MVVFLSYFRMHDGGRWSDCTRVEKSREKETKKERSSRFSLCPWCDTHVPIAAFPEGAGLAFFHEQIAYNL